MREGEEEGGKERMRERDVERRRMKGERRGGEKEENRREKGEIRRRLSSDMHLIKQTYASFAPHLHNIHTPSNTLSHHSAVQEPIDIHSVFLTFSMTLLSVSLLRSHHPTPVFLNSSHERSSFWTHGTAESSSISASE